MKPQELSVLSEFQHALKKGLKGSRGTVFVPTGIQDLCIEAFGNSKVETGKVSIINFQCNNNAGKTSVNEKGDSIVGTFELTVKYEIGHNVNPPTK